MIIITVIIIILYCMLYCNYNNNCHNNNLSYKTQTQSLYSDSVTPSPNGYCSEDQATEPYILTTDRMTMCHLQSPGHHIAPHLHLQPTILCTAGVLPAHCTDATLTPTPTPTPSMKDGVPLPSRGLVWAVTDFSSVPKGSVLINPQTLQPFVNQDG